MTDTAPRAAEPLCTQGYERLRSQAVRPGAGADRRGLTVVAGQGVAVWLRRLAELPVAAPAAAPRTAAGPLPGPTEARAIDILLAMARAHLEGGTA